MISLWNFSQPDLWGSSFILAKLSPEPCQEGDYIRIGRPRQFAGSLSMYDSDSLWAAFSHRTLEWRHHSFSITVCRTGLRTVMDVVCSLQPYVFLRWPPFVHGQQWWDSDRMVSEGPAAREAAHVLLFPQQLRSWMKRGPFPEDVSTIHGAGSSRCSTRCLSRHPVMTPVPLCTLPQPQGPESKALPSFHSGVEGWVSMHQPKSFRSFEAN